MTRGQSRIVGLVATNKQNRSVGLVTRFVKAADPKSVSWIGYKICKIAVTGLSEELTGDCCY
jgi:hypothetical protein